MTSVTHFEIKSLSKQFYGNGNQQIRVDIEVLKEDESSAKVPLTDSEFASVTVVAFSSDIQQMRMPYDWAVGVVRNRYDMGLVGTAAVEMEPIIMAGHADTISGPAANGVADIIYCYVRAYRSGSEQLMARMQLEDGTILTTNMSSNGYTFTSSVTLTAIPPLSIPVSRLVSNSEYKQGKSGDAQTIQAHYWTLPAGVSAYSITTEDMFYWLDYTGGSQDDFLTIGHAFPPGVTDTNARDGITGDCVDDFPYRMDVGSNEWAVSVVKKIGCHWTTPSQWGTADFTIVDNRGNTHTYRVSPSGDHGSEVSISAA